MFGIAIAQQNPRATIVASDWPAVLAVAEENARRFAVSGRYRLLPGDVLEVDLGDGFDAVVMPNVMHLWDRPTNVRFLKKVHAALAPKGRVELRAGLPQHLRTIPVRQHNPAPQQCTEIYELGIDLGAAAAELNLVTKIWHSARHQQSPAQRKSYGPETALIAYVLPGFGGRVRYSDGARVRSAQSVLRLQNSKNAFLSGCLVSRKPLLRLVSSYCGDRSPLPHALFQHDHADWPSTTQQLFMTLSTALLLLLGLIVSAFYVRKL